MPRCLLFRRWWVAASTLVSLASCSEHYPIAPTLCDEWCNIENPNFCWFPYQTSVLGDENPADCVSRCESNVGTREGSSVPTITGSSCAPLFSTYLRCVKHVVSIEECGHIDAGLSAAAGFAGDAGWAGGAGTATDAGSVGVAGFASSCNCEWNQFLACKRCVGIDCAQCRTVCGLEEQNSCPSMADMSCLEVCLQSKPRDARCMPAFQTYMTCWKGALGATGNGGSGGTCDVENQMFNQCVSCYDDQIASACTP